MIKNIYSLGIIGLMWLICILACSVPSPSNRNAATPNPNATWHEVLAVSGKSIKQTETFTITGDEWRISWSVKAGGTSRPIFQIYVYNSNGSLKGVAANVQGADDDSTIMRGAGTYYLKILNTAQPYGIVVEDKY